jgi:signal peptidase II
LSLKNISRSYIFLFLVSGTVILLDQLSKAYIRANLREFEMWAPWDWMLPYARFTHIYNTGVAFGMFQGVGMIFAFLAVIVALAIIYYFPRVPAEDWTLRLAMGLQLGGAVGNLIDRIFLDWRVTDFISVGSFPIFNIADASITIGVGVLILGVWIQERRQKQENARLEMEVDVPSPDSNTGEA